MRLRELLKVEKFWKDNLEKFDKDGEEANSVAASLAQFSVLADWPHPSINYNTVACKGFLKVKNGKSGGAYKTREVAIQGNRFRFANGEGLFKDIYFTPCTTVSRDLTQGPFAFKISTGKAGDFVCFDA